MHVRDKLRNDVAGVRPTCDPVTITVLPRFSSMNESAEEVYARVSVPCRMRKPSNSS